MTPLLSFRTTDNRIGISTRAQIDGPESFLLNAFVEQYARKLSSRKQHYALFFEPLLPTGYPDLVVVAYNPRPYERWTRNRLALEVLDLKVLHHLHFVRKSTSTALEKQLAFSGKQLLQILERLLDAHLIRRDAGQWVPQALRDNYAIRNIETVEAKISDWEGAFRQGCANQWFASQSCILSPVANPSCHILNRAKEKGLGVYSMPEGATARILQRPLKSSSLPISYASWLFNEWIGRRIFCDERETANASC